MNKIAAVMVLGLLPLAGCATPYPYAGYGSGPYTAYDDDYDQGEDGYGPPVAYSQPGYAQPGYGQPGYGPAPSAGYSYYSRSTYPQPYAPAYYSTPPVPYGQPTQGYNSSYYSAYSRCGCAP